MAEVVDVHVSPTHTFSKQRRDSITLLEGMGVQGDAHCGVTVKHRSRVRVDASQPNLRQVHLIHSELFDDLREAAEELGITGVVLTPIGEADYADDQATYHAFGFMVTYDGPIRWQPEEVAWGDWVTFEQLAGMLADPARAFAPDTRALMDLWQSAIWPTDNRA